MWFIVASWQDPESGHAIYGPFPTKDEADRAVPYVLRDYHGIESMDQVPPDVIVTIEEPIAP